MLPQGEEVMAMNVGYTIIRNLRGSWPEWCADLDDGQVVFVYIRYGEVRVGVGDTEQSASFAAIDCRSGDDFAGVVDVLVALNVLRELGYYYVCPTYREAERVGRVRGLLK